MSMNIEAYKGKKHTHKTVIITSRTLPDYASYLVRIQNRIPNWKFRDLDCYRFEIVFNCFKPLSL